MSYQRRYYFETICGLCADSYSIAHRAGEHRYAGDCNVLGEPCLHCCGSGTAGHRSGALASFAVNECETVMIVTQIPPNFWNSYGPAAIALVGFLINGLLAFGAAQKLAGQREEQAAADQAWKSEHLSQSNVRDIAIAALQAMGNSNEATVRGIQGQLILIHTELQELRNRAVRGRG